METTDWPVPKWPGDVVEVGSERALEMLEEVPAAKRLYDFEEMVGACEGLGELPALAADWREWFEGHVEHMAHGGYVVGRPAPEGRG